MPPLEHMGRHQWALLWRAEGFGADGRPIRAARFLEIQVTWSEGRRQSVDPQGNVIALDAQVNVGNLEVPVGSFMWKGSYSDLLDSLQGTGTGSILEPTLDMFEVKTRKFDMDIRGRVTAWTLGLARYSDSLPDPAS